MPNMRDRMRLKDRILENIGKAIRIIQDCQSRSDESLVMTNTDWQLHKLVEHLDHAFLHGLRHVTKGYWVLVGDFTDKSTIKNIDQLTNVTTNLGKSRAWLYQALNDQLLESYTKCYMDNQKLIKKFYVKEALVLDEQRLQILMTLVSGLEMMYFQLQIDVPYLDLASYMKQKGISDDSEDRISISSLDSSISQGSTATPDAFEEGSNFTRSLSCNQMTGDKKPLRHSLSLPLYDGNIITDVSSPPDDSLSVEVTHLTSKSHKGHRRKTNKRRIENEPDTRTSVPETHSPPFGCKSLSSNVSSVTVTPTSPESGYRSVVENQSIRQPDSEAESTIAESLSDLQLNSIVEDTKLTCPGENIQEVVEEKVVSCVDSLKAITPVNVQLLADLNWTSKELQLLQSLEVETQVTKSTDYVENNNCDSIVKSDSASRSQTSILCASSYVDDNLHTQNHDVIDTAPVLPVISSQTPVDSSSDSIQDPAQFSSTESEQTIYDEECDPIKSSNEISIKHDSQSSAMKSSRKEGCISEAMAPSLKKSGNGKIGTKRANKHSRSKAGRYKDHDAEVTVDNNLMLMLMLEVFESEDEKLLKMYQTCLGHTDGDVLPIYVLLSDSAIYLLTTKYGQKKFKKEGVIKHRELDFISVSLNYQIINVVCTNRRKQFWITTGDEQLTRCIVSHMDLAVRKSETALSALNVFTDATTQKIAIKKWLVTMCKKEVSDVEILQYNLVNWEDLGSTDKAMTAPATNREGVLLYRTDAGLFFNSYWKQAYFVLRDGFLYQYTDRHDNQPPKLSIQLNQEDCVGCRHCRIDDQEHCFEVVLSNNTSLQLSGGSEAVSREWLQSLCQAVSQGMGMSESLGILPSCCVLTNTHIMLFHEDLQTNFCRTLASSLLTDLVHVATDAGAQIYLVLVFESSASPDYKKNWALYFNTVLERDKFLGMLDQAWKNHFHVCLPRLALKDAKLKTRCREGIGHLKKQRRV